MKAYFPSIIISSAIVLLGTVALWIGTSGFTAFTAETERRVTFQKGNRVPTRVTVENQDGVQSVLGESSRPYQIIDFIYTRCPTMCQAMGSELTQLQTVLKNRGLTDRVELLSISFDSANESPATLSSYLQRHKADPITWQATRIPDLKDEQRLLEDFDVTVIPDTFGGYVHNAAFYLLENDKIIGIYDYKDTRSIISKLSILLDAS